MKRGGKAQRKPEKPRKSPRESQRVGGEGEIRERWGRKRNCDRRKRVFRNSDPKRSV